MKHSLKKIICFIILGSLIASIAPPAFAAAPSPTAQERLQKLTGNSEIIRKIIGGTMMVGGIGFASIGLGPDYPAASRVPILVLSVIPLAVGYYFFNNPMGLEYEYSKIMSMPSSTEADKKAREDTSAGVLKEYSDLNYKNRTSTGAVCGLLGLLVTASFPPFGVVLMGLGAYAYYVKGPVEVENDEYMRSIGSP